MNLENLQIKNVLEKERTIWRFFNDNFGYDFSSVSIVEVDIEESADDDTITFGYYRPSIPGTIFINSAISNRYKIMTVVHELNHLMQFECRRSLCFQFKATNNSPRLMSMRDRNLKYRNKRMEIDSRLMETYFGYYINKNRGIDHALLCADVMLDLILKETHLGIALYVAEGISVDDVFKKHIIDSINKRIDKEKENVNNDNN